jgi:molecular chaperone DnaK (HSP70)
MLDALPYGIGVLTEDGNFCELLPKDATLPVKGSANFALANITQAGVTLHVVEDVDGSFEPIQDFTFLLHRLTNEQISQLRGKGQRTIEVGLMMRETGELVVSIFDETDFDHVRKRAIRKASAVDGLRLEYQSLRHGLTREEKLLISLCVVMLLAYVALKLSLSREATQRNVG